MPITVEYRTRRSELWSAYATMLRSRLWRTQLLTIAIVMVVMSLATFGGPPPNAGGWITITLLGLLIACLSALYPQLRFKPQQRRLTIDSAGITTEIGKRSGSVAWKDVHSVTLQSRSLIVQGKRGDAFIIPVRAFASPEAMEAFAREAEEARRSA